MPRVPHRRPAFTIALAVALPRPLLAQCPDGTPPPCTGGTGPAPRSVAVLTFDNITRDTTAQYLAEGLADQIFTRLAQVDRLTVISRSAVRRRAARPLAAGDRQRRGVPPAAAGDRQTCPCAPTKSSAKTSPTRIRFRAGHPVRMMPNSPQVWLWRAGQPERIVGRHPKPERAGSNGARGARQHCTVGLTVAESRTGPMPKQYLEDV